MLFSLLAGLFIGTSAMASMVTFNPSVFYYTREESQGSSTTKFNQTIINLKLGYVADSGLYLGIAYDMESRAYGSGATDQDRKSTGATIGYVTSGWQFLGSYYFTSELEDYKGTGYAVDVGYTFNLGSIGIGPMLSYRHWEYDKQNNVSLANKLEHNNVLPSIQFQFSF